MREEKPSRNETNAEATAPTFIDWVWKGSKETEADGTGSGGGADGRGENCTSLYNYETNYDNKIHFRLKYKMTDTTKTIFVRRSSEKKE